MSAAVDGRPSWRRCWRSPVRLLAVTVLLVGLLASFLANDVPLVARVDGNWAFPAVADCFGLPTPGPSGSWKHWWSRLPADSADLALMPPWPYGPLEVLGEICGQGPSLAHPLGIDTDGHDMIALLVHGTRTALCIGGTAVLIAALLGSFLGAIAGYRRGLVDVVVLRLIEIFLCFPWLLLLMLAASMFGDSRLALILVMASLFWTSFARIVRGEMLSLRERDFVKVARRLGVREWRVLRHHLLPQLRSQIGVTAAFCMAAAIIAESTLSFLGLGPGQQLSSWGHILRTGDAAAAAGGWHQWLFPSIAVVGTVLTCHLLADQLRDRPAG
ncbi:MAG: ABC transporter permease [Planctomycetes bacterium]|nr:ABC transporter permease [Planctomycetota bacterium]